MKMPARLAAILFPERCPYCGTVIPFGEAACARCQERLPRVPASLCATCGMPESRCRCDRKGRYFERCAAPFFYQDGVKRVILRFKEQNSLPRARKLAAELEAAVRREFGDAEFDGLVPVPMTKADLCTRGFNQSAVLTKELSRLTGMPMYDCLEKRYPTAPQKTLPAYRRSGNVLGVFDLRPGFSAEGLRLLLVDDLMTTGATLNECAKVLRLYGAETVYAAVLAVTPPPKKKK